MMSNTFLHLLCFMLMLATPNFVLAQANAPASANSAGGPKSKKTTVNFEDQLIEGQAQKPDLLYLLQKKKFNYKRLIRLRENFLPELRQSADEMTPVRRMKEKKQ
jgi:hypothetical protein